MGLISGIPLGMVAFGINLSGKEKQKLMVGMIRR